jgi:hypothetical protein
MNCRFAERTNHDRRKVELALGKKAIAFIRLFHY